MNLAYSGYFEANLCTLWCTFTGLNNTIMHQNWQLWGMNINCLEVNKKLHNLYPCNILIYGTCISYKYISNHCQTRPPVQVLPFPGFSKECTVFVLRTGGALSPKMFPKLGFVGIFIWSLQAFSLRWNACNQGIILEEWSSRKVLRNIICVTVVK